MKFKWILGATMMCLPLALAGMGCSTTDGSAPTSEDAVPQAGAGRISQQVAIGGGCRSSCACDLGLYCNIDAGATSGTCERYPLGPQPLDSCFCQSQCPYGDVCAFPLNSKFGKCQPAPSTCTSACDCGVYYQCNIPVGSTTGTCDVTFGPGVPACRSGCTNECPAQGLCTNSRCPVNPDSP